MTPLTEQELLALEALCNAATPGPWEIRPNIPYSTDGLVLYRGRWEDNYTIARWNSRTYRNTENNVAFIAAARAALPRVLKELRDARERVRELEMQDGMAMGIFTEIRAFLSSLPCCHSDAHSDGGKTPPMFFKEWIGCVLAKQDQERDDFARRCIHMVWQQAKERGVGGTQLPSVIIEAVKDDLAREKEESKP